MNLEPVGLEPEFVAVFCLAHIPPVPFWETTLFFTLTFQKKESPSEWAGSCASKQGVGLFGADVRSCPESMSTTYKRIRRLFGYYG